MNSRPPFSPVCACRVRLALVLALVISTPPALLVAQDVPVAPPAAGANLSGDEMRLYRQLSHREYRMRTRAVRELQLLPIARATAILARGLREGDARVRRICADEISRRQVAMPELAPILIDVLRDEVVDTESAVFAATRDALLRIGPAADAAFRAAVARGLLDTAPELESLGRQFRLRAVVQALDDVPLPENTFMVLPFAGQFRAVTQPEWIAHLAEIMHSGAPEIGESLDDAARLRRRTLACFALGEWAAGQNSAAREWVLREIRAEWSRVTIVRSRTNWFQTAKELFGFALDAVAYQMGDGRPIEATIRDLDARIGFFDLPTPSPNTMLRVPGAVFYLTTHKAFLLQATGRIEAARELWHTALHAMEFESGVSRETLALAHVFHARALAAKVGGADDVAPIASAVCDALSTAIDMGFRDENWLRATGEFARLRATPPFADVLRRLAERLQGPAEGDGTGGGE